MSALNQPAGYHANSLADPANPGRYLRSRTGLLHLRAAYGVEEEDGLSDSVAECGVEVGTYQFGGYMPPVIPADGRPLCKRCVRSTP